MSIGLTASADSESNPCDRGYTTVSLADLFNMELPEVAWVVNDIIPAGSLVLLVGRPKAGKSLLMIDLAASVAGGTSFLGRKTSTGTALYLPAEDALPLVVERLRNRCGDHESMPLYVLPGPPYADQIVRIDNPVSLENLAFTLQRDKPQLLVLDPFRELHHLKENDAEDMSSVLRPLRQIAHQTGTAIVLVHHRNKHAVDAAHASRGSSAISGSVDAIITLDGVESGEPMSSEGQVLTLSIEGRYGPRQLIGAQLGADLKWSQVDPRSMQSESVALLILRNLESTHQSFTPDEIACALDRPLRTVQNALPGLVNRGKVVRSGSGVRNDPFRYSLPPRRLS